MAFPEGGFAIVRFRTGHNNHYGGFALHFKVTEISNIPSKYTVR